MPSVRVADEDGGPDAVGVRQVVPRRSQNPGRISGRPDLREHLRDDVQAPVGPAPREPRDHVSLGSSQPNAVLAVPRGEGLVLDVDPLGRRQRGALPDGVEEHPQQVLGLPLAEAEIEERARCAELAGEHEGDLEEAGALEALAAVGREEFLEQGGPDLGEVALPAPLGVDDQRLLGALAHRQHQVLEARRLFTGQAQDLAEDEGTLRCASVRPFEIRGEEGGVLSRIGEHEHLATLADEVARRRLRGRGKFLVDPRGDDRDGRVRTGQEASDDLAVAPGRACRASPKRSVLLLRLRDDRADRVVSAVARAGHADVG